MIISLAHSPLTSAVSVCMLVHFKSTFHGGELIFKVTRFHTPKRCWLVKRFQSEVHTPKAAATRLQVFFEDAKSVSWLKQVVFWINGLAGHLVPASCPGMNRMQDVRI